MKVSFNFNEEHRTLVLEPTDELEAKVLEEMASRCEKGSHLKLSKINHPLPSAYEGNLDFRVELKVNGK